MAAGDLVEVGSQLQAGQRPAGRVQQRAAGAVGPLEVVHARPLHALDRGRLPVHAAEADDDSGFIGGVAKPQQRVERAGQRVPHEQRRERIAGRRVAMQGRHMQADRRALTAELLLHPADQIRGAGRHARLRDSRRQPG